MPPCARQVRKEQRLALPARDYIRLAEVAGANASHLDGIGMASLRLSHTDPAMGFKTTIRSGATTKTGDACCDRDTETDEGRDMGRTEEWC